MALKLRGDTIIDEAGKTLLQLTTEVSGGGIPMNSIFEYDGDTVPDGYEEVPSLVDTIYPVGSIYMNATPLNPETLFKGTKWERFGKGRTLVSLDEEQDEFKTAEQTGGHKDMQSHTHGKKTLTGYWYNDSARFKSTNHFSGIVKNYRASVAGYWAETGGTDTNTVGIQVDASHEHDAAGTGDSGNLQPYITVYMWKRIE